MLKRALLLLCLLPLTAMAADEPIHRCRHADGSLSFSDYPCPGGSQSEAAPRRPAVPAGGISGIEPICAKGPGNRGDGFSENFRAELPAEQSQALDQALVIQSGEGGASYQWRRSPRGDLHLCSRTPRGQTLELVAGVQGQVVQFRAGVARYLNDPETPEALLERCRDLVTSCVAPPSTSVDSCVHLSQTCDQNPPWAGGASCCPQACKDEHARLRAAGAEPMAAFLSALDGPPSCIPGH
ncbi:MAG: DUF4124 domain-containing protein [Xanthomonadales bacterium]|nr:DUF4124 domain-containing protein [Xanthomonadales bacterium]